MIENLNESHKLFKNFLSNDSRSKKLYQTWLKTHDKKIYEILSKNFANYVIKMHFYSYVFQTLKYKSLEIKRSMNKLKNRELLSLNTVDPEFNEEKLTTIPDEPVDYIEEIYSNSRNFQEIIMDKQLLEIISKLTPKQQAILLESIIWGKKEKNIAQDMGISVQAVNKAKKSVLNKIRRLWKGCL